MKLRVAALRETAAQAQLSQRLKAEAAEAAEKAAWDAAVQSSIQGIALDIERVVTRAAYEGHVQVVLYSGPMPKDTPDYRRDEFEREVAAGVLARVRAAGSDINVGYCPNPLPCAGGEDNYNIMAYWGE